MFLIGRLSVRNDSTRERRRAQQGVRANVAKAAWLISIVRQMMKFTATYDVTPKLQDDSVKQFYWRVLLRPRIGGILAVLAVLLGMIVLDPPYKPWVVGFFSAMFFFLIITWVKAYFQIIAQARAGLRLMENPKVEILLDDSVIEYVSSTGTRRHQWEKIE